MCDNNSAQVAADQAAPELPAIAKRATSNAANPEVRESSIGCSEIAAVFGVDPWKTRLQLYMEKVGELPPADLNYNDAVRWGVLLEDIVAQEYAHKMGVKIRRNNRTLRNPECPYLMAHLDREVVGSDIVAEVKTVNEYSKDQWGEEFTDQVPERVLLQGLGQLYVTGKSECHVPVLIGGNKHRIYVIHRGDHLDKIEMIPRGVTRFWTDHVMKRVPPAIANLVDVSLRWPSDNGLPAQASPTIAAAVKSLRAVKAEIKALEETEEALKVTVCAAFADAAELFDGDDRLATYKSQTTNRIDTPALKKAEPDIAARFTKASESRVLRLSKEVN